MLRYVLGFGIAFVLSLIGTFAVRSAARRLGLLARPRADRWHRMPTALYGGVGIYAAVIVAYLLGYLGGLFGPLTPGGGVHLLLMCASGMFVLGLVDDRLRLSPHVKLIFQIVAAGLFTRYGLRLHWLPSPMLDQGLTLLWLVGITNALNLLDNIDGLAGGVAAIGALFLVYLCHHAGQPDHAALAAVFAGAVAGFLVFNFNPASIFMGDCGSLFLGFMLSGQALVNTQPGGRRHLMMVLLVPVLLLLLPILDTALVTISRKLAGRSISTGGRDHTSHRLVALGLSERAATLWLWTVAAGSGSVAVLLPSVGVFIGVALAGVFLMGLLFLMVFLGRVQVYEPVDAPEQAQGRALLPTLADFSYKRRVFEVAADVGLILLSYYGAFVLRYDGNLVEPAYGQFLYSTPVVMCLQLGTFVALGVYRGVWRYTDFGDLIGLLRAVGLGVGLSAVLVLLQLRPQNFSRTVFAIDGVLLLLGVSASRLSFRLLHAMVERFRRVDLRTGRRALIYGAGERGELVLRELREYGDLVPVGFVDDDPSKQGRVIHGLRVLGAAADLGALLKGEQVSEVVVAGGVRGEKVESLRAVCSAHGARLRQMRVSLE